MSIAELKDLLKVANVSLQIWQILWPQFDFKSILSVYELITGTAVNSKFKIQN